MKQKYTKEILNIIKIAINLAFNDKKIENNNRLILIKPIHLFISIFLTNNFISNLYFIYNKNLLNILYNYKKNKINYFKYNIIFSKESLNLLNIENNIITFTSLNLFTNILNINDIKINKILEILKNTLYNLKNNFIDLFLKNNLNLNKYLFKYLIQLNYKLNKNKFIKIINNNFIYNILNNTNLFLIGEEGVGKKSIIYNYISNTKKNINNDIYYLDLNIKKLLINEKYYENIENYLYKLFKVLTKYNKIKYYIIINDVNLLFKNNDNFNININNLFKYFLKFKNLKFIFTSTKNNYLYLIKKKESFFNTSVFIIDVKEPSISVIKSILKLHLNNYYKKYKLKLKDIILDKLIHLFYNYNLEKKNPLKIINFLYYIFKKKIKINFKNYLNIKQLNYIDNHFTLKYFKITYNYFLLKWVKKKINYTNNIKLIYKNNLILFKKFYNFKNIINIKNDYLLNNKVLKKENYITIKYILKYLPLFIKLSKEFLKSKLNYNKNIKNKLQDYIKIEKIIRNKIFGQNNAIKQILNSIKKNKLGLKSNNKPIGSYIFAGLSGTGKTELVKALTEGLFGDEKNMIRFDMSEFMEKHSISRLIGSPPGYIGHENGGQLTNLVLKNPYSVILLDEIEKAHIDITNILLQLLDDGRITDSKGNLIDFSNTIIILTTNLGSPKNLIEYPFLKNKGNLSKIEFNKFILNTNLAIEKFFKPEFLNRLDSIIIFKPLGFKELKNITYKFINDFNLKLKLNLFPIYFYIDIFFINLILKISYKPLYGARPLKRIINKIIEKPINELLLFFTINKKILIYFYIDLLTNKPSFCLLKN